MAVGGGTRGGLWTQIVSDITGRPQDLPERTVGAAYGDALLAGRAVGLAGDAPSWNPVASVVEPRADTGVLYDELYRIYRELYPATRAAAHALARLQI